MNYSQFFAVLANQCARFAPNAMVPDEFEEVLSHVRLANVLADLDKPLMDSLAPLLGPKFRAALSDANSEVKAAVRARLDVLEGERKAAHAERVALIEKAQLLELERAQENERLRKDLSDTQAKIQTLEEAVARLQSLK